MLLLGALFALFVVGFWLYCLADVAFTPRSECRGLPKAAWLVIVAGTSVAGAVAWLVARRPARAVPPPPGIRRPGAGRRQPPGPRVTAVDRPALRDGGAGGSGRNGPGGDGPGKRPSLEAEAALLWHPAGRSRACGAPGRAAPQGPDDDPEFLRGLDEVIRGSHAEEDLPDMGLRPGSPASPAARLALPACLPALPGGFLARAQPSPA